MSNFCNDHDFYRNHLVQEVHSTLNYGLGLQSLRVAHECDLYGCSIYDCETSKHGSIGKFRCFLKIEMKF